MTLIELYQAELLEAIGSKQVVVMGENINNGSRLSGLGKNLETLPRAKVINIGNCELTHIGTGMGMMMQGKNLILMVKQLDFLLLGLDQMVNTLNWIKAQDSDNQLGSFTILTYICNQGFQGPQSSLVDLTSLSVAGAFPSYILQEKTQTARILNEHLLEPGFRIIAIPQKIAKLKITEEKPVFFNKQHGLTLYGKSKEVLIVSCHSSFSYAIEFKNYLTSKGKMSSIALLDCIPGSNFTVAFPFIDCPKHCLVIDDAKSPLRWGDFAYRRLHESFPNTKLSFASRKEPFVYSVNSDDFGLNNEDLYKITFKNAQDF